LKIKISNEDKKLLQNLVLVRKKFQKTENSKYMAEYKVLEKRCAEVFDYLVDSRTKRYKNFSNYEDLKQDARIALLSALKTYDFKKGSFYWWATYYIKTKVSREANCHSTVKIPLKKARDLTPHKVLQFPVVIDRSPTPDQAFELDEFKQNIKNQINSLPLEKRKVIELYYGFNGFPARSMSKVCKELKISMAACSKLLEDAKENLKELILEHTSYD